MVNGMVVFDGNTHTFRLSLSKIIMLSALPRKFSFQFIRRIYSMWTENY